MNKTGLLITLVFLLIFSSKFGFSQTLIGNPMDDEIAANVVVDTAGNSYVGGMINNNGLVVKQNAAHTTIWSKRLSFTANPSDKVVINFLDWTNDFVFGCGIVEQANQSIGTFYFKMNAQTGNLYWSKFEQVPNRFFSCMRYSNGRFFLIGGVKTPNFYTGDIQGVSALNGQQLWLIHNLFSGIPHAVTVASNAWFTEFLSATEMVDGKMFVTGVSKLVGNIILTGNPISLEMPVIIGVTELGSIFLTKDVLLPISNPPINSYRPSRIEYDTDKNLILGMYSPIGSSNMLHAFLLKCDTLGNLIFSKSYELPSTSTMFVPGLNETMGSYVLFGGVHSNFNGLYALKVAKNGNFEKCVGISKPGVSYENGWSNDWVIGNSSFSAGVHHFSVTEQTNGPLDSDINQILFDEDLNPIADCWETIELFPVVTDVQTTIEDLGIGYDTEIFQFVEFLSVFTVSDQSVFTPCVGISTTMMQNSGCTQSTITVDTVGFISPTFYWSNGTISSANSITVNSTDTVFVRVLDTKCCELIDTIVPVFVSSSLSVVLPSDTTVCIPTGNSFVIAPMVTGAISAVQYLWSDNSTGTSLSINSSGTYWVDVSDNCLTQRDSIVMVVNYFPELDLPTNLDTCFEIGVGFSFTAQGSLGSYQWSSGSQTATEWISQEGVYSCTLTNQCGSITDSMQVRRLTAVDLYFPDDSIRECEKQLSVSLLHIETNYNLEVFAPNGDLVGTHLSESGWYLVHAFNVCGEKWDSIYVNLQNEQFFYLPNSFTPNGDLNNERFEFKGENIVVRDIRIFNRWGEEIFTENGKFTGWDGTYQGENCPDGIYAVHVIYEDCFGIPTEFNGHVNLLR
jgi:gliding motility-associated-like protein